MANAYDLSINTTAETDGQRRGASCHRRALLQVDEFARALSLKVIRAIRDEERKNPDAGARNASVLEG